MGHTASSAAAAPLARRRRRGGTVGQGLKTLAALAAIAAPWTLRAQPVDFLLGGSFAVPVVSQKASRFDSTMRQQFDFSCGSAAVATLLTFHYGTPTSEAAAFQDMLAVGDRERIRREGFSLLDMKRYLARRGFEADGFELPLEKLAEARMPAIVLVSDKGYHHFVVVKGLRDGRVLIGDPAAGTRVLPRALFEQLWTNRLLFVIHNQQDLATFNAAADWQQRPVAPLAAGVVRDSLGALTIPRLGVSEN